MKILKVTFKIKKKMQYPVSYRSKRTIFYAFIDT